MMYCHIAFPVIILCWGLYRGFRPILRRTLRPARQAESVPLGPARIYRDIRNCELIVKSILDNNPVEARATPNRRLVRAFGINNAFTTTEESYQKHFVHEATKKIKKKDEWWKTLAGTSVRIVQALATKDSQGGAQSEGIFLVPLLQSLVLKLSIYALFDISTDAMDDAAIEVIAQKINTMWIDSKRQGPIRSLTADQKQLFTAVQKIIPYNKQDSYDNPLNFILPSYETMWRIVLRCFLEIRFRSGTDYLQYLQSFESFFEDPTLSMFKRLQSPSNVSVENIVNEALRLYPPTRRIYRQTPSLFVLGADIEFLHRDPSIWGDASLRFRPSRWRDLSQDGRSAFMPFGRGKFTCPSKGDASPRMISILVAALLREFQDYRSYAGDTEDSIGGVGPQRLDRDCYSALKLIRGPAPEPTPVERYWEPVQRS